MADGESASSVGRFDVDTPTPNENSARLVAERKWHESQRVRENKDGSIILELELGGLEEIERWILSWGDQAEVLEPAKLRQRLAELGRKFVAQYGAK